MSKLDKKKNRLQERINSLQTELTMSLTKKTGNIAEINVGEYQRRILELRIELSKM